MAGGSKRRPWHSAAPARPANRGSPIFGSNFNNSQQVFPIPPTVANVNSFFALILLLLPLAPLGHKLRHAIPLATFHGPPFDNLAYTCSPNFQVLAARGGLASQCSYHHSHSMLAVMLLEEWVSICYDINGLTGLAHQLSFVPHALEIALFVRL